MVRNRNARPGLLIPAVIPNQDQTVSDVDRKNMQGFVSRRRQHLARGNTELCAMAWALNHVSEDTAGRNLGTVMGADVF